MTRHNAAPFREHNECIVEEKLLCNTHSDRIRCQQMDCHIIMTFKVFDRHTYMFLFIVLQLALFRNTETLFFGIRRRIQPRRFASMPHSGTKPTDAGMVYHCYLTFAPACMDGAGYRAIRTALPYRRDTVLCFCATVPGFDLLNAMKNSSIAPSEYIKQSPCTAISP